MPENKFPCTQCGCCCKRVGEIVKKGLSFPYKIKEDGSCEMLTKENKCKIYDSRPLYCNIPELGKALNRDIKEFYAENIKICNELMEEDNIELKYRIKTD